jgi:UDPglucose 6-dehydrogenase
VERALHPERFMVGLDDPAAGVPWALQTYLSAFGCPILPMRYESAELAKVAINLVLVATLTAANTLAEVCAAVGGDWSEVEPALRLDARIGPSAYLRPGLGIGGANLDRDLVTVARLAAERGVAAGVILAWQRDSEHRKDWALRVLHRELLSARADASVTVLGLTYKEGTSSTRNSPGVRLSAAVGATIHDPVVAPGVGALETCRGADAVAIMTPWPEYAGLAPDALAKVMRGRIVVDPFGVLDHDRCTQAGLQHHVIGRPVDRIVS